MNRVKYYDKADEMDNAIYELYQQGILTFNQRYHCDKKLQKWANRKSIKWHKKVRSA